eukprot:scaffold14357_cov101-Isochrysis_galbana.AAC.3
MILRKRSYRWPDAREKMCTVASSSAVAAAPLDHHLLTDPIMPARSASESAGPAGASSSRMEVASLPGSLRASNSTCWPEKSAIVTRSARAGSSASGSSASLRPPAPKTRVACPAARSSGAVWIEKTSEEGPGARERSQTPGAALSWK